MGAGPAALYLSILARLDRSDHEITLVERDPRGATYGWGVTYWPDTLAALERHDPVSAARIRDSSLIWGDGEAHVRGRIVRHAGDSGYAVGRHRLLEILSDRARELGVRIEYERELDAAAPLPDADLVVAADGMHSQVRSRHAREFGTRVTHGANRFLWLGTTKVFTTFGFSFVETPHGWIWCYAYGYTPSQSTCVVECSEATWRGLGFEGLGRDECLRLLEGHFSQFLEGHSLTSRGEPRWQSFRTVVNASWAHGNVVLIGDAAHTTHFSIGAGTALAFQDAIALARQLRTVPAGQSLGEALGAYERERMRALLPVQSAARLSAQWYENLPRYAALPPEQMFALLGQRHSPVLPHVPPRLYYALDQLVTQTRWLRPVKRRLGHGLSRVLQRRHLAPAARLPQQDTAARPVGRPDARTPGAGAEPAREGAGPTRPDAAPAGAAGSHFDGPPHQPQ